MKHIGDNLKTIRKVWNKSQDEFGVLFGLNRGNINSYEGERNEPSIEFFIVLEELTGIPIRDLVTRKIQRLELPERPYTAGEGIAKLQGSVNVNVANGHGSAATQQVSAEGLAQKEIAHLKELLAEKERLIQVLLAK
jgi:DNA-binding XRE family transcriptional regulator